MSDETEKWSRKHHPAEGLQFEQPTDSELFDRDALLYGVGFMQDGKRINPHDVYLSPEAQLLAEAVKVISFYADEVNQVAEAIIDVMPDRRGEPMEYIKDFDSPYGLDKGQRARDFLAMLGR